MKRGVLMIILCSIATMLPRILPYFMPFLSRLPKFIRKCMNLLPVAALGALIFPLALTDFGSSWYAGFGGVALSFLVAYLKAPMIVSIVVALVSTTLLLII
ncbi:MAG: AzlD domain-containing protein [Sphaerochaetaceae bacterium]|nr:AzlD domain-containing protein [Sphaerochaetaceae bacterium]